MANDIDKTSPHYKGEFGSIYEVNQKFPSGGVEGDYVAIDGWAHYWNADRGTWCVNAQRDSYWDELITGIINKLKLFKGATYMGVAGVSTVPEEIAGVKMYYFAKAAGTYSGFGGLQLAQGINVLYTDNGTSWTATPLLEVAQELGVSTEKVMSQKAVNTELGKKADKEAVNTELGKKADKEAVDTELGKKADKEAVNTELGKKADKEAVDTALGKKADKEAVNTELGKKADKEAVDTALGKKADKETVDTELGKKADKETVDTELGKKADKEALTASLDLKANKSDVVKTNAAQDAEIGRKANQQDVERSLNILRKEIGERTIVEGNVSNNPDEEDLTSKMGSNNREVLSLKDREYNPLEFSGKGYKILRKNLQEVTCAITKIQVTKAPTTDGYVSIIINGVETHVDLVASTDNTVALVAKKIADKLSETMDEYVTSIDGALVTCTRRFGGDVSASSFSGVNTGSEATVSESSKTELRNLITAAMINQPNTLYEIRYDFDLDGKTIEVPEGCTLKFEGGSLGNGTVKGNETFVQASLFYILKTIVLTGTFTNSFFNVEWFGAKADGRFDSTKAIQNAIDNCINIKNTVQLNVGTYRVTKTLRIDSNVYSNYYPFTHFAENPPKYLSKNGGYFSEISYDRLINIKGAGSLNTVIQGDFVCEESSPKPIIELSGSNEDPKSYFAIEGISILGKKDSVRKKYLFNNQIGLSLITTHRINVKDISVEYCAIGIFMVNTYWTKFEQITVKLNWYGIQWLGANGGTMTDVLADECYCGLIASGQEFIINNYSTENCYKDIFFIDVIIGSIRGGYLEPFNIDPWGQLSIPENKFSKSNIQMSFDNAEDSSIRYCVHLSMYDIHSTLPTNGTINDRQVICDCLNRTNSTVNQIWVFNCRFMNGPIMVSNKSQIKNFSANTLVDKDLAKIENTRYEEIIKKLEDTVYNKTDVVRFRKGVNFYSPEVTSRIDIDFTSENDFKEHPRTDMVKRVNKEIHYNNIINIAEGSYRINCSTFSLFTGKAVEQQGFTDLNISSIINALKAYGLLNNKTPYYPSFGKTAERPTPSSNTCKGFCYFDNSLNTPLWWNGYNWVDKDGNPADSKKLGSTSERPTNVQIGFIYKDTTLGKLIIWNGTAWVNMDGTALT